MYGCVTTPDDYSTGAQANEVWISLNTILIMDLHRYFQLMTNLSISTDTIEIIAVINTAMGLSTAPTCRFHTHLQVLPSGSSNTKLI